ncbi:MAG TPA: glycosyltransferase, partial [Acidimicrobiales bacterium]|nr:glycosyltransferase [Acidimicrobiales bacterium]
MSEPVPPAGPDSSGDFDDLLAVQSRLTIENAELRLKLRKYEASRLVELALAVSRVGRRALPVGTLRRKLAGKVMRGALRQPSPERQARQAYRAWLEARRPAAEALARQRQESSSWTARPLVSVCMPVYNPRPEDLRSAIASVRAQSYDHWELCICDDGSSRSGVSEALVAEAEGDRRIKLTRSPSNGGIARATNAALALAEGDFVGFLDDDDLLEPHTLYLYMAAVQGDPNIEVLYCDEDVLLPSGERAFPFLKPGWSPETLLGMNYITHFVVARRSLVEKVGGLRPERDGAQDHDLLLRLSERTDQIRHIPEVLYSWRQSPTSASMTTKAKPWAYEAGAKAVQDALDRRGVAGRVEPGAFPGAFRVRYRITEPPPEVTILIPTRDRADLLGPCLQSIEATTAYRRYSIVVLDNDSREPATADVLRRAGVRVVPTPGPFNYPAIINRGFAATD